MLDIRVIKTNNRHKCYFILLVSFGVFMLLLNMNTPKMLDDYDYSLFFPGPIPGEKEPIVSIGQFFSSWFNHYFTTNGRIANFIASFFCVFGGKSLFNFCNTLVIVLFVDVCTTLFAEKRSVLSLAFTIAFVLFVIPIPSQTMLWLDGSCNYLWSSTITLCFVKYFVFQEKRSLLVAFPLALLAGSMHEGVSISVFMAICVFALMNRHRLSRYYYVIFLGFLLGFLSCCLSPGILIRLFGEREGYSSIPVSFSFSVVLIFVYNFAKYVTPIAGIIVPFLYAIQKRKDFFKNQEFVFFFVCLFTNALFLIKLGMFYPRMFFFISVFGYIVIMKYLWPMLMRLEKYYGVLCCVIIGFSLLKSANVFSVTRKNIVIHEKAIALLSSSREMECVLPSERISYNRHDYSDRFVHWLYTSDKYSYNNVKMAEKYHKESIQFVPEAVFKCFQSDDFLGSASPLNLKSNNDMVSGRVFLINNESLLIPIPQELKPVSSSESNYYTMETSKADRWNMLVKKLLGKELSKSFFSLCYIQNKGKFFLIIPYIESFNSIHIHYEAEHGEMNLILNV